MDFVIRTLWFCNFTGKGNVSNPHGVCISFLFIDASVDHTYQNCCLKKIMRDHGNYSQEMMTKKVSSKKRAMMTQHQLNT